MRGRIRQLKPDIFVDDEFWAFRQQHPELPLFEAFLGLLCQADREGRFEWRPLMLQSQVLPYWRGSFAAVLDALATGGYVVRYEVNGRIYGYVRNFAKHQRPGNREPKSILPSPPEHAQVCSSSALESSQATRASLPQSLPQLPTPNPDPLEPEPPESAPAATVVRPKSEPPPRLPPSKSRHWPPSREVPEDWAPVDLHRVRCQELRFDVGELQREFRNIEFKVEYSLWDKRFSKFIEDRRIERETERAQALTTQTKQARAAPAKPERSYADLVASGEVRG